MGDKLDRLIGTEVAGYRITRKLGQGGMGAVFEAIEINLDRARSLLRIGVGGVR